MMARRTFKAGGHLAVPRLVRYVLVSVAALAMDVSVFMALMTGGTSPITASCIGYVFGIIVHWLLSSRAVFAATLAQPGSTRHWQAALFVASALVGLAITMGIVWAAHTVGMDTRLAKFVAVGISFGATYIMRATIVFRADASS